MYVLDRLESPKAESPDSGSCKALLDRILASQHLKRSARLRELLAYVGRRALEDGCTLIREQELGVELFARPEGYDTSADTIVRVNATELRKRIESYFANEGLHEPIVMEIPRGSYIPVFRIRPVEGESSVNAAADAEAPLPQAVEAALVTPKPTRHPRWTIPVLILAALLALLFAGAYLNLWMQNRAMHRSLYPWQYKPSVAAFWFGFLAASPDTDLVVGDPSFSLFQAISKKQISLQDYLSQSYVTQLQNEGLSPDMRRALGMLAQRTMVSRGGFTIAQHLLALEPLGHNIHVYLARSYNPSLIKQDNVIIFGSRSSNPWNEIFESQRNFVIQSDVDALENAAAPHSIVEIRSPLAGEQQTYMPSTGVGYCTIAYLPNPGHTGRALLFAGTNSEATQACGEFILSEDELSTFRKRLPGNGFPYFELLLKTSHVAETPLTTTIVAYRTYPDLH